MKTPRSSVWPNLAAALAIAVVTLAAKPIEMAAQEATQSPGAVVPTIVQFSGALRDANGKPLSGTVDVTFLLYKEQQGGAPLWLETQNVQPDKNRRYTVQLGATSNQGLPKELFTSGEARWLAVQAEGQAEQPRIMLLSVPYAMKAGDAETIGGLPPSAFVLAAPTGSTRAANAATSSNSPAAGPASPASSSGVTTTGGTDNALPLWTTATNIQSSAIAQTGTGATAKIGVNTNTPAATLDMKGSVSVERPLTLPATGAATATAGKNSQPQGYVASSF